jgi:hypothetical protein
MYQQVLKRKYGGDAPKQIVIRNVRMTFVLRWRIDIIKDLDALIALDDLFVHVIRLKENILKLQSSGIQPKMMIFYQVKFLFLLDVIYGGFVKKNVHMDAYMNINKNLISKQEIMADAVTPVPQL